MKNFYEILEVSENASKEVIEKAYKVLVKRYHPDLQENANKEIAKKNMQEINEAYEILSDDIQRKNYDEKLDRERKIEEENRIREYTRKNQSNENEVKYMNQKYQKDMQKKVQKEYEAKYQDAYDGYLRSLGYKVKHRWTLKNIRDIAITITIMVCIGAFLWFYPPTHKLIINFYNSNKVLQILVNLVKNFFVLIYNVIISLFKTFK